MMSYIAESLTVFVVVCITAAILGWLDGGR